MPDKTKQLAFAIHRLRNDNPSNSDWYHIQIAICEMTSITLEDLGDLHLIFTLDWSEPSPTGLEHAEAVAAGRRWNDVVRSRLDAQRPSGRKATKNLPLFRNSDPNDRRS